MKFIGIIGRILEHIPFAIKMAERFLGKDNGASKQLAASKEIVEFVSELIDRDPLDDWSDIGVVDYNMLVAALKDEKEFVKHIMAVNDSVVGLVNYVNSKAPQE